MPPATPLEQALSALEQGDAVDASRLLAAALKRPAASREEELAIRCALAEAWILQADITKASAALGRTPDLLRESLEPARVAALWRLHGRVAYMKGEQSRAIALQVRALKQAELAHDSRAIGLSHYELGLCYNQVGDRAIVQEHIAKAATALHAVGDRRHLAFVHSLSGISLAQAGRTDEAIAALRQAERLATTVGARDVLATVCGNQAVVAMMLHRYEQAAELAARSVALHEALGSGPRLAISLATLGQIHVKLGDLTRAEAALHRALEVRSPIQFHETTGAVYDTLAQMHLIRGDHARAREYLERAGDAYGAFGTHTNRWYEWSVKVLQARLELRAAVPQEALRLADAIRAAEGVPPVDASQAELIAVEALVHLSRIEEADRRLRTLVDRLEPREAPAIWAESLRLRGLVQARAGEAAEAYHDLAQSCSVFDLLGERYEAAVSHLALGQLVTTTGGRTLAERHLAAATEVFSALGAERDRQAAHDAQLVLSIQEDRPRPQASPESEDAIIRRLVDAAALPDLLGHETAAALAEAAHTDLAILIVERGPGDLRVIGRAGCDAARALAVAQAARAADAVAQAWHIEPIGRAATHPRLAILPCHQPLEPATRRRLRTLAVVARQGFDLCAAREPVRAPDAASAQYALEPLLPGFVCASAAMNRVTELIRRLQGNDLTVLITGESGTGKELVARAIHVGSQRRAGLFLPYNCTTTARDLADSQLFGHRRGAFTGAVSDAPGLVRTAASGTLFLDEIGDLPIDIQPKLLRVLEQQEIMPVGETRPQRVDVRVIAATNADLEQRVAEGTFREDLYYRLSVIRIHVPPLRDRREEIPHLATFFLRESCDRLNKPDVRLSPGALQLIAQYWWPGNVRQLRNEIQRAVAMSAPGDTLSPEHLSPELSGVIDADAIAAAPPSSGGRRRSANLASAVSQVERDLIQSTLTRHGGNISQTARELGLTRRGLYLKLKRLGVGRKVSVN
ncbi:MAG TPA: sigma 54-interacting transcriptional regulator [Vicinamibacterales bacterium]